MNISEKLRYFEILAVVITGVGKFIFMDYLNWRFLYISFACIFWIVYVGFRSIDEESIKEYWGLTFINFRKSMLELLPFAVLLSIGFIVIGNLLNTSVLNIRIIPILIIYPIWGIIQQFIMIGILAKNLKDIQSYQLSDFWIVFITSTLFAVVHFPFILLVMSTFSLAIVYTNLFLKGRNLVVMGIYHGLLGALYFYTILGRDPFIEVFGN